MTAEERAKRWYEGELTPPERGIADWLFNDDAILARLAAEIRAAQAEALREAAESIHSSQSIETSIQSWLRARADAIERGEDEQ